MQSAGHTSPKSRAPLRRVWIGEQVLQGCLRQAFAMEKEEVMSLLLGRIEVTSEVEVLSSNSKGTNSAADGTAIKVAPRPHSIDRTTTTTSTSCPSSVPSAEAKVAYIWGMHISERSVQQSDRVEVAGASLVAAAEAAERMSVETGIPTRVVGWFHSHPKIPVVPSVVDLGTQWSFQQHVDSGWVGLIASVFNMEARIHRHHCDLHCFQAGPGKSHAKVPFRVVPQMELLPSPGTLSSLPDSTASLVRVLRQEIVNAVASVEDATNKDGAASQAARSLAAVQLFHVDCLVTEPSRKELESFSLPLLREEVARLELAVSASSTGNR